MPQSTFQFDNSSAFLYRLIDISILLASLLLVLYAYGQQFTKDYALVTLIILVCYSFVGESLQLYRSWRVGRFRRMLYLLIAVHALSFMSLTSVLFLFKQGASFSRVGIVGWYFVSLIALLGWRIVAKQMKAVRRERGHNLQKVAIVGGTAIGLKLYQQIQEHTDLGFDCLGFFDDRGQDRLPAGITAAGTIDDAVRLAQQGHIQKLYICLPMVAEKRIADIIHRLGDTTVDVLMVPEFLLKNLMHARVGSVGEIDTLSVFESPVYGVKDFYKRTFDVVFSVASLIAISPLMLLIALAVKLSSPGPVLFTQKRYGLDGKPINVYKFRSMRVTENGDTIHQATKNDPRVTKLGAFLRRTSLDELPQFFNVVQGDMSVVGPRPHANAHNEEYRKKVDYYMLRHKVRPGITGWAQVNGWRGETDTLEKMEMRIKYDLDYIRHWSFFWDLKIIFLTISKGFTGKNAY